MADNEMYIFMIILGPEKLNDSFDRLVLLVQ